METQSKRGDLMKTRADLTLEAHTLLDRWVEARRRANGGKCTRSEMADYELMRRRTCVWNRKVMLLYCTYLATLPVGGRIKLDRPEVYAMRGAVS